MKAKVLSKIVSGLLCLSLLIGSFPETALAYNADYKSDTHTVFKHTEQTLAPGVEQYTNYAYSSDGKQMIYYVATADINREDVIVQTSYKNQFENREFGMAKMTEQIAYANQLYSDASNPRFISPYYNVVVGVNASFYNMGTGQPSGVCYLDGMPIGESASYNSYFAILKDGKAIIDYTTSLEANKDNIKHAVAGSVMLVYQGKDVTGGVSGSYNTGREPRTCVGVTADGKVVVASLDGRQEPRSCGASMHELAQIMLEADCEYAINLDGGGSTTYIAKNEGSDECTILNNPSDGSERAISSGLMIASLAVPSNAFDHVTYDVENEYLTPGTSVNINVSGASLTGNSAEVPEDITYEVTNGKFENNVFTAAETEGDAVITAKYKDKPVGTATLHVVTPDRIEFEQDKITIPYGKTVPLTVNAYYGLQKIKTKAADFHFELSDPRIGQLSDGTIIGTSDETVTGGSITVSSIYNGSVSDQAEAVLGKASKIVYDFESGSESIAKLTKGYKSGYEAEKYDFNLDASVVTAENGKVKHGNYALKLDAQYKSIACGAWPQVQLNGWDVDLTDAVSLSFWMYIPEGSHGAEWDIGNAIPVKLGHWLTNGCGWQYFTVPVSDISTTSHVFNRLTLYMSDTSYEAGGYLPQEHPNYHTNCVFYLDDITVNYSSAVEDNDVPLFDDMLVGYAGVSDAQVMNGQTIQENNVSVSVKSYEPKDKSNQVGLDISSMQFFVDGQKTEAKCTSDGVISADNIVLANGVHTFRAEISDLNGNEAYIERKLIVNSPDNSLPVISYEPASDVRKDVLCNSLVWMNLKTPAIETVDSTEIEIELDNNNIWELDHMELIPGFSSSYVIDPETNTATITITRTGDVEATGEAVLASLPVRVFAPHYTVQTSVSIKYYAVVSYIKAGKVTDTNGNTGTFTSNTYEIGSEFNTTRELNNAPKNTWHNHTDVRSMEKEATCLENGYTGRTFCDVCNSVVEWGTTIPATGHDYEITDGVLKCTSCGKIFTGTWTDGRDYYDGVKPEDGWKDDFYYTDGFKAKGVCKVEGSYYDFGEDGKNKGKYTGVFFDKEDNVYRYSQLGEISSGWKQIDDEWYYFLESTKAAANGEMEYIKGIKYEFEENGKLKSGVWKYTNEGNMYYYGPTYYYRGWQTINGKSYYFARGYCYTGYRYVEGSNSIEATWYDFGEDGALIGKLDYTGLLDLNNEIYYLVDGISKDGLQYIDGAYYYFKSATHAAVTGSYYVWNDNGLLPKGTYEFGSDGKMLDGIVEKDGRRYYYELGKQSKENGLVKVGDDYYYIQSGTSAVVTGWYYVWNDNGLLPKGEYEFGPDGKMLRKAQIVEKEGKYYYYEYGIPSDKVGLIEVNGIYYYIQSASHAAVTGTYYVWNDNGLLPRGYYEFESDGKLILTKEIVERDGKYYYYVNGKPSDQVGLIEVNGDYYYIQSGSYAAVTGTYYVWNDNGLLPRGTYVFNSDGKMVKKRAIVDVNGKFYFYENGVQSNVVGLVEVDGNYYYIQSASHAAVTGAYYVWNDNGLMPRGYYEFGADGKMIL